MNNEDKYKKCRWMRTYEYKNFDSEIAQIIYDWYMYIKITKCLPPDDLYEFNQLNSVRHSKLKILLQSTILSMRIKMYKQEMEKMHMVDNWSEKKHNVSLEDIEFQQLTQKFQKNTCDYKKQMDDIIPGYKPSIKIMETQAPIEIREQYIYQIFKYNKFHGYYAVIIRDITEKMKPWLIYGKNVENVKKVSEEKYNELINNYKQQLIKNNPYANTKPRNTKVDIDKVKQAMGYDNTDDLLNNDDIF